ncbi:MAG: helix-turn-helix transcriptional regulator [Alphaproteobacteria bacterium]|nr:helix-turn-helix transcriptional regulator [Alphaproteobacteria bacterium]
MATYVVYGTESLMRRLREHRFRLGFFLNYVAKAADISADDLTQYEYGKKPITQEELLRLANLYKVSPAYFLGGLPIS